MPDTGGLRWVLDQFVEQLDSWIVREFPDDDLRLIVTEWAVRCNSFATLSLPI